MTEPASSEVHVATLVHLTDLHLYVDANGESLDIRGLRASTKLIKQLLQRRRFQRVARRLDKLDFYDPLALEALIDQVPRIVQTEPADVPVIILHTGDAETLGPQVNGGVVEFGAYDFIHDVLCPAVLGSKTSNWFDVYGNHDVWPGVLPILDPSEHKENFSRIRHVRGLDNYAGSQSISTADPGLALTFHRLNSVHPRTLAATFANGKIGSHPVDLGDGCTERALDELANDSDSDKPSIRVVLMHHPPHPFDAGPLKRYLTTGRVEGSKELGERANRDLRIHIVVAGHRHAMNPPVGTTIDASKKATQKPLPARTIQIVAESPTSSITLASVSDPLDQRVRYATSNSFCLYRLFVDQSLQELRIQREQFSFEGSRGTSRNRTIGQATRGFNRTNIADIAVKVPL
jgi:hypothetical protein